MKSSIAFFIPLLCLLSCTLENDQIFVPQTQRAFLLLNDKTNGQKSICEILDSTLDRNLVEAPFWEIQEPVIDMAGFEEWIYVIAEGQKLYRINLSKQERWVSTIEGARPSSIVAGESYLLLTDTSNQQLIFVERNKVNPNIYRKKITGSPQKAIYRSGRFFVLVDSTIMASYHETGFSLLGQLETGFPIVDFRSNNRTSILMLMRKENTWYLGGMDWNNAQWNLLPTETAIRIFRTTPYFRSAYEKEWLRDVEVDTTRRLFLTKEIRGMEVDFFESNVYFLSNDTLERFNIRSRELLDLGVVKEEIIGSYFYIGNDD